MTLLQSPELQSHVSDLLEHGYKFSQIVSHLTRTYGLDLGSISTVEELQSLTSLSARQAQLENELSSLNAEYQEALNQAIAEHRKSVFEQDEKRRSWLEFISDIGFDLLPKSFTDQLISEIRA